MIVNALIKYKVDKLKKGMKKYFLIFFLFLLSILTLGAIFQLISTQTEEKHYPPPGSLVDVNGHKLHIYCSGSGNPAVILDAGGGSFSLDWFLVQSKVALFTKVCSYDRAGYGWSDKIPGERTSKEFVMELHTLLKNANISPPYILVGHSFGGINVQLYAINYPNEVVGLVLVDSAHEDLINRIEAIKKYWSKYWLQGQKEIYSAFFGINRLRNKWKKPPIILQSFSKSFQDEYIAKISSTKHSRARVAEGMNFSKSLEQLSSSPPLPKDIPLIVIRRGKKGSLNSKDWEIWKEFQRDTAEKSKVGRLKIAEKSGHMIPWEDPNIIVKAIRTLVDEYQASL